MRTISKLLIGTTATLGLGLALLAAPPPADAGVSVGIGIGIPVPGVVFGAPLPPPVVVGPPVVYGPPVAYGPPVYYGAAYGYGYGYGYEAGRRSNVHPARTGRSRPAGCHVTRSRDPWPAAQRARDLRVRACVAPPLRVCGS